MNADDRGCLRACLWPQKDLSRTKAKAASGTAIRFMKSLRGDYISKAGSDLKK
jgi:hypothetical protein